MGIPIIKKGNLCYLCKDNGSFLSNNLKKMMIFSKILKKKPAYFKMAIGIFKIFS
jgi:hypothetical protein